MVSIIITCILFLPVAWCLRTAVWLEDLEDAAILAFILGWVAGALIVLIALVG